MTSEDMRQELEKRPFIPLRLHLASGKTVDIAYEHTAWLQQNALLLVHPLSKGTVAIGKYEVIALRLIERTEQISESSAA
jgi:hypothetical protein